MNYYELDVEEQKELEEIDAGIKSGKLKSVPNFEQHKKLLQQAAKNRLNKTRNINILLSEQDLYKLKVKAIEEDIRCQTLAASILHKSTAK